MHAANWVWVLWIGGLILLLLIAFPPTRVLLLWLVSKPVLSGLRHVFHEITMAHGNVIRNLQPRNKIFSELTRKQTSHTEES